MWAVDLHCQWYSILVPAFTIHLPAGSTHSIIFINFFIYLPCWPGMLSVAQTWSWFSTPLPQPLKLGATGMHLLMWRFTHFFFFPLKSLSSRLWSELLLHLRLNFKYRVYNLVIRSWNTDYKTALLQCAMMINVRSHPIRWDRSFHLNITWIRSSQVSGEGNKI